MTNQVQIGILVTVEKPVMRRVPVTNRFICSNSKFRGSGSTMEQAYTDFTSYVIYHEITWRRTQ